MLKNHYQNNRTQIVDQCTCLETKALNMITETSFWSVCINKINLAACYSVSSAVQTKSKIARENNRPILNSE